jgi:selenocysteine lyase/cysteine desulfurase
MLAAWGLPVVQERLLRLTERISASLRDLPVQIPETHLRAPHVLSLGFKGGVPKSLIEGLAAENIYVAPRLGRMRISPHVYNDEADVDRFVEAMRRRLS